MMTDHDNKSRDRNIIAQESGVTTSGDVTQNAGGDIAGRDIIYNIRNFLSGSSDDVRYWSGVGGDRRATEQRRRLAVKMGAEYKERLEQIRSQAKGYPRAKLRTAPEAVADPLNFLETLQRASPVSVPPRTSILQLYRQRQSLLVLGEPGSGKTTLLLELAVKLLSVNDDVPDHVPVMAPLSTWERRGRKMRKGALSSQFIVWLGGLLEEVYKIPGQLGENWLIDGSLILLLDGLDEITVKDERASLLAAINDYISKYPAHVVLSCRLEEYQAIGLRAELERAVVIQALEKADILEFVERQGAAYADLAGSLKHDAEMLRLCTSPLFLSMLIFAYPFESQEQLSPQSELNTRARLLKAYVDQRFNQALVTEDSVCRPFVGDKAERSMKWLSWLAGNLTHHSQTDFLLERMRPSWFSTGGELLVKVCMVLVALPFLLLLFQSNARSIVFIGTYSVILILTVFTLFPLSFDLHWSLRSVFIKWRTALNLSVGCALLGLAVIAFNFPRNITYLTIWPFGFGMETYLAGALSGAIVGLIIGMSTGGFTAVVAESRRGPYESVLSSLWTGAWIFVMAGGAVLFGTLLFYKVLGVRGLLVNSFVFFNVDISGWDQGIHYSLPIAFAFAYVFGWGFVLDHLILRLWIWAWGVGPGRYVRWLNAMVRMRLLYRSGAGYVFMHRILQEFLQSKELTPPK